MKKIFKALKKELISNFLPIFIGILLLYFGITFISSIFYGGIFKFIKEIPYILLESSLTFLSLFVLSLAIVIIKSTDTFLNKYTYKYLHRNFIIKIGIFFITVHSIFLFNKNFYLINIYDKTFFIFIFLILYIWLKDKRYTLKYFIFCVCSVVFVFYFYNNFIKIYLLYFFSSEIYYHKVIYFITDHVIRFTLFHFIYNFFKKVSYNKT